MTDVEKALRGDHKAAKRVTEARVLLPCPFGGSKEIKKGSCYGRTWYFCGDCMVELPGQLVEYTARLAWNTRAVKERKK